VPLAGGIGDAFGSGPVRVGMILPLSQNGGPSAIGQSLRNAAQLAVEESGANNISVIVEDDRSTPEGAVQATQAELAAGARILVGPLYAADVRAVGPVAKAAGKPVIAFSTDVTVASNGVYLLSFLIESYVDRIMEYAASKGKKSFAVLAPLNDNANVAVTEAQLEASKLHMKLVDVARYSPGQPMGAAEEVASVSEPLDAVFVAEQAEGMSALSAALTAHPIKAQLLGTGMWSDSKVLQLPGVQGAWFSAPENGGFSAFADRYRARFKSDPARLATLSYDAISLVAALARAQGAAAFSEATLTNPSGFNGADGVFRFRADGPNERGLAVMEVSNGAAKVISPAPHVFAGG
jgi:ABC-type branched-subunit amino acid transport system substrate-binding protein